jgi:hypothetical protein
MFSGVLGRRSGIGAEPAEQLDSPNAFELARYRGLPPAAYKCLPRTTRIDRTIGPLMNRVLRANLLAATNPGSRKYREHSSSAFLVKRKGDARRNSIHPLSAAVGALPLARAVDDPRLSNEILESVRDSLVSL